MLPVAIALYILVSVVTSLFYGAYAVTIWFRAPDYKKPRGEIPNGVWRQAWKDLRRHPAYVHAFWFNFAGSFLGWAALGYAIWRLFMRPVDPGERRAAIGQGRSGAESANGCEVQAPNFRAHRRKFRDATALGVLWRPLRSIFVECAILRNGPPNAHSY